MKFLNIILDHNLLFFLQETYIFYSTSLPEMIYENLENHKARILKENKGKSGVYCLRNMVNQKIYVGSSVDLRKRFYVYFSLLRLNTSKMAIYKALLKYGYSNFTLEILEYCERDEVVAKEQKYIDILKPEYNINPVAGSSLGFKHSEETLAKMRSSELKAKHSEETRAKLARAATGRVLSEDTKAKISDARLGIKLSDVTRAKLSAAASAIYGVAVVVKDIKTGQTEEFSTLTEAGVALGVSRTTVKKVILTGKILRGSYIINLKK